MSSSRRRATITTTVVFVVAILMLATTPTSFLYKVANAAPNRILQGSGSGTLTCPDGSTVNVGITVTLVRQGKNTGGFFSIFDQFGREKPVDISQGQVNPNQYKLQGIERFDAICGASTPTTVSVSGTCGIGVTGQFTAANGERASFSGNFACSA